MSILITDLGFARGPAKDQKTGKELEGVEEWQGVITSICSAVATKNEIAKILIDKDWTQAELDCHMFNAVRVGVERKMYMEIVNKVHEFGQLVEPMIKGKNHKKVSAALNRIIKLCRIQAPPQEEKSQIILPNGVKH